MQTLQNFKSNKRWPLITAGVIVSLCIICGVISMFTSKSTPAAPVDTNAIYTSAVQTAFAPMTETANAKPVSTSTPVSTATLAATDTPIPPTATTAPIILQGTGDSVVAVQKNNGAAIMKVGYQGGSNFAIENYDDNNTQIDLLVNTIGSYQGTLPLDFLSDEHTARFQITASGPWKIQILPLTAIRHAHIPGQIQGTGDDVIYLDGKNPDTLVADASKARDNFVVYSYGDNGRGLAINKIAPYTGTVMLDQSAFMISVNASGSWTLSITTK